MTSEVRSVPVTTRPMDKYTPLRKESMRILRLLEVSETRRASGVAWNAGDRRYEHSSREALPCAPGLLRCPCEVLTTAHVAWEFGRPLSWGIGAAERGVPQSASS